MTASSNLGRRACTRRSCGACRATRQISSTIVVGDIDVPSLALSLSRSARRMLLAAALFLRRPTVFVLRSEDITGKHDKKTNNQTEVILSTAVTTIMSISLSLSLTSACFVFLQAPGFVFPRHFLVNISILTTTTLGSWGTACARHMQIRQQIRDQTDTKS